MRTHAALAGILPDGTGHRLPEVRPSGHVDARAGSFCRCLQVFLRKASRPKDDSSGTEMSSSPAEGERVFFQERKEMRRHHPRRLDRAARVVEAHPQDPTYTARDQLSVRPCSHSFHAVPYGFFCTLLSAVAFLIFCVDLQEFHTRTGDLRRCWSLSLPFRVERKSDRELLHRTRLRKVQKRRAVRHSASTWFCPHGK